MKKEKKPRNEVSMKQSGIEPRSSDEMGDHIEIFFKHKTQKPNTMVWSWAVGNWHSGNVCRFTWSLDLSNVCRDVRRSWELAWTFSLCWALCSCGYMVIDAEAIHVSWSHCSISICLVWLLSQTLIPKAGNNNTFLPFRHVVKISTRLTMRHKILNGFTPDSHIPCNNCYLYLILLTCILETWTLWPLLRKSGFYIRLTDALAFLS